RLTEAEEIFKRIGSVGSAEPEHRGALGAFYAATGRNEAARAELLRIVAAHPDDIYNARRLAEVEIASNRREEARKILSDLATRAPNDWQTLLLLGGLDIDDGKVEQAERRLTRAKSIQPASPMIHFQLARVHLQQGKLELAKDGLRAALKHGPGFTAASVALAELELRAGEPQRAMRELKEALKHAPDALAPGVLLSQVHALQDEHHLAEKTLTGLLEKQQSAADQATIYRTLAWVKLRQKRFNDAKAYAEKSLSGGQATLEGLRLLGLSYFGLNRHEEGLNAVRVHVRKKEHWAAGHGLLGELALQAGKTELAEEAYRKELKLEPNSATALFGLGSVHQRRRQYEAARQYYERAAAAAPGNAAIYVRLGELAELKQEWPQAITAYKKAIELDSSSAVAKNNLAWIYAEHDSNIDEALRLAQEARELMPKAAPIADTLGWIYVKKDLASTALPLLQECALKEPKNAVCRYHLGAAYFKLGRTQEAKRELETALRLQDTFPGSADAKALLHRLTTSN
ncbi:MAG TPA: tetratricopeptide repeat protein, partial [Burkholderiaceae bacterium]|nr:tetratricopeptide repeat protein [Burkholderiaceae bacterium]